MTGAVLYFIFKFLSSSLNIDGTKVPRPRGGRTTAAFRAARREKQHQMLAPNPPTPVVLGKASGRGERDLLSQTIVEEEDSDF